MDYGITVYIRYTVMKLMCDLPYILCAIDLFFAPHMTNVFLCSVTFSVYSCIEMSFSFQVIWYKRVLLDLTYFFWWNESPLSTNCISHVSCKNVFLFTKHDKMAASFLIALHKYLSTMCCNNGCVDFCFPNIGLASFI